MRSSVRTDGDTSPRSMRDSIEREMPAARARLPPDAPEATRRIRICAPTLEAGVSGKPAAGVRQLRADAGTAGGRSVGNGDAAARGFKGARPSFKTAVRRAPSAVAGMAAPLLTIGQGLPQ